MSGVENGPTGIDETQVILCCYFLFSFVNLFCTLLETVSIILVVFIRFVLTFLLHARICGVLVGRRYED